MMGSLVGQGMSYAHISIGMQLYIVAQQIKWSDESRFKKVIIHPGAMHIIMSFLGCIGGLMKGSGLDQLVLAAYKGLKGITNGKAGVTALLAF